MLYGSMCYCYSTYKTQFLEQEVKYNKFDRWIELYKIGNNKIICTVENVLYWLICVSISNLHNYFVGEAF